jgi:TonB family protein
MERHPLLSVASGLTVLLFAMVLILPATLHAQREGGRKARNQKKSIIKPDEKIILVSIETMAKFPGGDSAMAAYLQENLIYPQEARDSGFSGTVYVSFIVERDGSISNVELLRRRGYIHPILEEAALEAVRNMPTWTPGEQRGMTVRSQFVLPVQFQLSEKEREQKEKEKESTPPPEELSPPENN